MTKGPFCDHTADGGQGNQPFPSLLPPHKDYRQQRHRCTME